MKSFKKYKIKVRKSSIIGDEYFNFHTFIYHTLHNYTTDLILQLICSIYLGERPCLRTAVGGGYLPGSLWILEKLLTIFPIIPTLRSSPKSTIPSYSETISHRTKTSWKEVLNRADAHAFRLARNEAGPRENCLCFPPISRSPRKNTSFLKNIVTYSRSKIPRSSEILRIILQWTKKLCMNSKNGCHSLFTVK